MADSKTRFSDKELAEFKELILKKIEKAEQDLELIKSAYTPVYDSGYSFNVPVQEAFDAFAPGDARRDASILDIIAWSNDTGAEYVEGYEHTGFYNRKYLPRKGDQNIGDQNLTNPNNYRSIRFADVLLMAAEALNRGGDEMIILYF